MATVSLIRTILFPDTGSPNSNLVQLSQAASKQTPTCTEYSVLTPTAVTGTTTISLTTYTTVTSIIVYNKSTTISVLVGTSQPSVGATTNVLPAGRVIELPSANATSLTLTTSSGTADCEVYVVGS